MKHQLKYFVIGFILFFGLNVSAQTKKQFNRIEDALNNENYTLAFQLIKTVVQDSNMSAHIAFKAGVSCFNLPGKMDSALMYFEKAENFVNLEYRNRYTELNAPTDTWYYLGKCFQKNFRFDEAVTYYRKYIQTDNAEDVSEIQRYIDQCEFGNKLIKIPKDLVVFDLGPNVGTLDNEHSPVLSDFGNSLIFTTKLSENDSEGISGYNEDLFASYKVNGRWTKAKKLDGSLNTSGHEASAGISKDGKRMYLYKDIRNGDIYYTELSGSEWSEPKPIEGENINTKYRETHICVNSDETKLFFSSNRTGGLGGSDIYLSVKKDDGMWGEPQNLGAPINTKYNEEGAFWSESKETLFFSSDGHLGMGGYDLFESRQGSDNTWQTPVNLGYPANSPSDDIFYFVSEDNPNVAYYVSNHFGTTGNTDIYSIVFPDEYTRIKDKIEGTVWYPNAELLPTLITVFVYHNPILSSEQQHYIYNHLHGYGLDTTRVTLMPVSVVSFDRNEARKNVKRSKNPELLMPTNSSFASMTPQSGSYVRLKPDISYPEFFASSDNSYVHDVREFNNSTTTESGIRRKTTNNRIVKFDKPLASKQTPTVRKTEIIPKSDDTSLVVNDPKNETEILSETTPSSETASFTIYFDYNQTKTALPSYFKDLINKLLSSNAVIEIYGHTDAKGRDSYNYDLAFGRISFVENYLISQGINPERIIAKSFGEYKPAAPNEINGIDFAEGRKQNRRVEIRLK